MTRRLRIGFLLNPVAGLGGPHAMKGSDDAAALAPIVEATSYDQTPSVRRSIETFTGLPLPDGVVVAAPGILGAEAVKQTIGRGGPILEVLRLGLPGKRFGQSTAEDTRTFARALAASDVDLIVFAGGDGTAIDVAEAVEGHVPILGIPTGVKMLSPVFAQTPAAARALLENLEVGFPTRTVDVVDLDEESYRTGAWSVRSQAVAVVPEDPVVQVGKGGETPTEAAGLDELATWFGEWRPEGGLLIVGAGTTTMALKESMGAGTPLGVDAYEPDGQVHLDVDAATLLELAGRSAEAWIVVSPTGTQGCVLGRGTAQISPEVVDAVGADHVVVVATPQKLNGVFELFVDTGDAEVDSRFPEYIRVRTDLLTEKMLRLRRGPEPARAGLGGVPDC